MNKLFGLFLLALACWSPDLAHAANRFLTCATTCTITAADTSIWGTVSGGTGATVPGSSDDVVLDAGTCVGGTTCTATFGAGYNPTWISLNMSACTASTAGCILDANPNTNTVTLSSASSPYTNNGAGTRTLSGGTWVLQGNAALWNMAASATVTNSPSVSFTATTGTGSRRFNAGGKTYGTVSVAGATAPFVVGSANTIGTLTVSPGNTIIIPGGSTTTVTTMTNVSGSSSLQTLFITDNPTNGIATLSLGNSWTCDWCGFSDITKAGAGSIAATSSFDFKGNTGITITAPSAGGGGGRIIGG